ncbi:hypothetical protein K488DRAFT_92026 [Vararia minispora EC-137]|uniref:Uncharacterized protein n=1 Tax=Vararia minispora EC-137 TaxID=1314806 RepID=A0ACB8Q5I5_9AGAM|nr:hypothetical protein K488DRAFT_92026 [Vararia minispora EC-137]
MIPLLALCSLALPHPHYGRKHYPAYERRSVEHPSVTPGKSSSENGSGDSASGLTDLPAAAEAVMSQGGSQWGQGPAIVNDWLAFGHVLSSGPSHLDTYAAQLLAGSHADAVPWLLELAESSVAEDAGTYVRAVRAASAEPRMREQAERVVTSLLLRDPANWSIFLDDEKDSFDVRAAAVCIENYNGFVRHIQEPDLVFAADAKPLLDGRENLQVLGATKPGV